MGKSKRDHSPQHRSYSDDDSKQKTSNLRQKIKEQEREIKRLKAELKTLNDAFKKSAKFMSDESKELTTEELIKAAKNHQTLKEAKKAKPTPEEEKELTRKKWADWAEQNLRKPVEEENDPF